MPIADRQFKIEFFDSAWRLLRSRSADPRQKLPNIDRHLCPIDSIPRFWFDRMCALNPIESDMRNEQFN
jgi:hypothetical protein